MPIAVHCTPAQFSRDDYEKMIAELEKDGEPDGRVSHTSYDGPDGVHFFEVWETEDHYAQHHDRLMASLQACGVDAGSVVHTGSVHRHGD
jgi:hypothetical protein